jgi:MerR family transcriptional regulator, copper efflux regulator
MTQRQSKIRTAQTAEASTWLKIGEVAKRTGLGVETLRFYERSGLLGRPARTEGGYRLYDAEALNTLEFIKRAQTLGFSLEEIKRIIVESRTGRKPCAEVRTLLRQRLAELDEQMRLLQQYRRELAQTLQEWEKSGDAEGLFCGLIENTQLKTAKPLTARLNRRRK